MPPLIEACWACAMRLQAHHATTVSRNAIWAGSLTLGIARRAGLDTCLAIMKVIFEGTGDSKYRPCPLLRQYVNAGTPSAVRLKQRL